METLKDFNTRRRFLKSTLQYWIKNNSGKAFRSWAEYTLSSKEHELHQALVLKETERKELQRHKDTEESQQAQEIEQLQGQLRHAMSQKEQMKANYAKALATHISRRENNVYVDKRRNIFCVWAEYIKKEKNAVNIIGAIARKQLRMEVFSRIRLVARERFLEANAERIMTNLFKLMKSNILTKSFSRWRVRTYTDVVREMNHRRDELSQTILRHRQEAEQMEAHKQAKALKILRQRKQREVTNAWIEMARIMKTLRTKDSILRDNISYMQTKLATQKWLSRTKLTTYLRRKNEEAMRRFRMKTLTECYK